MQQASIRSKSQIACLDHVSSGPCPLCKFEHLSYLFIRHAARVLRCTNCGMTMLNPQPTDSEITAFYANITGHDPFDSGTPLAGSFTEVEAANSYLKFLRMQDAPRSGMLLIAPKGSPF